MENNIKPLSPAERKFAENNYYLIMDFLKKSRLDAENYFDVVVIDFLLSVEIYLNNDELRKKCNFEAVSYMYMKRAVYRHFRKEKAIKRKSESGADISFNEIDACIGKFLTMEDFSLLEYKETANQIMENLTSEQRKILHDKLEGYSLKEIAENNGIKAKRVYRQFGKIKSIVANIMENQRLCV